MEVPHLHPDVFAHVRIIVGMVLALSIARLLTGLARFIQHPGREQVYPVHLGWAFSVLLLVIHFWWWEFRLSPLQHWTFEIYIFVILYAVLLFLLCTLLFPDRMEEYSGFKDYFMSRRRWFFGILALTFVFDVIDTTLKGAAYLHSFGIEYPIRGLAYLLLCLVAMFTASPLFHAAFIIASLAYQVAFILRLYATP